MRNVITQLLFYAAVLFAYQVSAQQVKHKMYIGMYCADRFHPFLNDGVGAVDHVGFDDDYLEELKKYGYNLILSEDPYRQAITAAGPNPSQDYLDRIHKAGLNIIIGNVDNFYIKRNPVTPYNYAKVQAGLDYYNSHPAVIGYDVSDEPSMNAAIPISQVTDHIVSFDENKLPFVNLWPEYANINRLDDDDDATVFSGTYEDYVNEFITTGHLKMLSFDFYPFDVDVNSCNWKRFYFYNLNLFGSKAAYYDIPFYVVTNTYKYHTITGSCSIPDPVYLSDISAINNTRILDYNIYSSLLYGAKGILYWPREIGLTNDANGYYTFDQQMSLGTKEHIGEIHKKVLDHDYILGGLKFESAYHVTDLPQVGASLSSLFYGQVFPDESKWEHFDDDAATGAIFNLSGTIPPILPEPTPGFVGGVSTPNETDYLAVSYMRDAYARKYIWLFNKNYEATTTSEFTLNFNGPKTVVEILEDRMCSDITSINVALEPGEGKLFLIEDYATSPLLVGTDFHNQHVTLTASDIVFLDGVDITGNSRDWFFAKHITVNPAVKFEEGCDVILKAHNTHCSLFHRPYYPGDEPLPAAGLSVVPNPNAGEFTLKLDGAPGQQYTVYVQTMLGQTVFSSEASGNTLMELKLGDLPDGMYLVRLQAGNEVINTVKTIVQH